MKTPNQPWPFPPKGGPIPWTPAQQAAYKRQQAVQQREQAKSLQDNFGEAPF